MSRAGPTVLVESGSPLLLGDVMQTGTHGGIAGELNAIFVSLELSRSTWLITSLSPGAGEKISRHTVEAGNLSALLERFSVLRSKARQRTGRDYPVISVYEAGLDGFWVHRALVSEGVESHVVDAASIATSRRKRRVKTDRVDGETLVRTLLAYKRGEPRICAMVRVPTPEEEDRRRIGRERKVLMSERIQHSNRIKGLLFSQGITTYSPLRRDRRVQLESLTTGDGRPLPEQMKRQILREIERLELVIDQLDAIDAERDAMLAAERGRETSVVSMLTNVVGVGAEFAAILWSEALFRRFDNRRQVAAYAGLAPTPWQSGAVSREQGVSKSGNGRLRSTLIQLAWLWIRHQPGSELTKWFRNRVAQSGGRMKKTMITALARKLLVALWKYATAGVVIEGASVRT